MTYLEKLYKALATESYSREELEGRGVPFLEKLIKQTMGWDRFNLMLSSWEIFDTL